MLHGYMERHVHHGAPIHPCFSLSFFPTTSISIHEIYCIYTCGCACEPVDDSPGVLRFDLLIIQTKVQQFPYKFRPRSFRERHEQRFAFRGHLSGLVLTPNDIELVFASVLNGRGVDDGSKIAADAAETAAAQVEQLLTMLHRRLVAWVVVLFLLLSECVVCV